MNPQKFIGLGTNEDTKKLMENMKMVFDVKLVVDNELVEIDVYQLNSVVRTLFDNWKWDRVQDEPLASWADSANLSWGASFPYN